MQLLHYRSPCYFVWDSYIIVYGGYSESGGFRFFCGTYSSYWVTTSLSRYAYVKFHTSYRTNNFRRGFSHAVYTAEGLVSTILINVVILYHII